MIERFELLACLIRMTLKINLSDEVLIIQYQQLYLKHDGDV
jgi:hypothetical protein